MGARATRAVLAVTDRGEGSLLLTGLLAASLPVLLPLVGVTLENSPRVVATIAPVQALVAEVMDGVGKPKLLVPGGASPHVYALRPSDAQTLASAQVVVLIDPSFETFLARPLAALTGQARVVRVADIPGVQKYPARGPWRANEQTRDNGFPHILAPLDDRGEDYTNNEIHGRGNAFDPHLWLDPDNARHIVTTIAMVLAEVDPANATAYHRNAETMTRALIALDEALRDELAPVAQQPFMVFHDAYQYLEARYGLNAVGAVMVTPERAPGARHITSLREQIRTLGVVCVFREPQFPPKMVDTIITGTSVRVGVLDPLGQPGGHYVAMMQANARALRTCLRE